MDCSKEYVHAEIEKSEKKTDVTNHRWWTQLTGMVQTNSTNNKDLNETVIKVQNDVNWLKKFFWIVAGSSVGALVTGIINLLIVTGKGV